MKKYLCRLCNTVYFKKREVKTSDVGYICNKCLGIRAIKKQKKTSNRKPKLRDECDLLWSEIVKKKAGYKSELSGAKGKQIGGDNTLNAHHIAGKPNYRLRYAIEFGICLTFDEHINGIHNAGRAEYYRQRIIHVRGIDVFEKAKMYKNDYSHKSDLFLIKEYLSQELEKLS